ncbi:MAG: peptidylprolyl isomerase [Chloroflexi bacterium]|nr:peptidylprolyl isomerase [Chloroflexota bacterium]
MTQNSKQSKNAKAASPESEPLKVNWWAILLAVAIVGGALFYSQSQGNRIATAPAAAAGDCADGTSSKQYSSAPPMTIDASKQYSATVKMAKGGEFVIELYPDKAPITVNSFVFLAREGYFNCVTFHRVLEGFMAQGGDPTDTGSGGPGYEFVNEDSDLKFDKEGVVAMANAGRDTNGSQFFITFAPAEFLNGGYTIFGQVTEGMEVVNAITRRDPQANPNFAGDMIESVTIKEK